MNKIALRRHYAEVRSHISSAYRNEAAHAAALLLQKMAVFLKSSHIACYLPVRGEFDANPIIEAIWAAKKTCYLPILSKEEEKFLTFAEYHDGDPLHFNRYQILEPAQTQKDVSPKALDLVITPLIAFDRGGGRLGSGGGYYDRTFAFLHHLVNHNPLLMGLGFALQEAQQLPTTDLDVCLSYVLTEKEVIVCKKNS